MRSSSDLKQYPAAVAPARAGSRSHSGPPPADSGRCARVTVKITFCCLGTLTVKTAPLVGRPSRVPGNKASLHAIERHHLCPTQGDPDDVLMVTYNACDCECPPHNSCRDLMLLKTLAAFNDSTCLFIDSVSRFEIVSCKGMACILCTAIQWLGLQCTSSNMSSHGM